MSKEDLKFTWLYDALVWLCLAGVLLAVAGHVIFMLLDIAK